METLPATAVAAAAAGGCPGWVMLEQYAELEVEGDGEDSTSNRGGVKITEAASRSSDGHVVRVSLRLEAPPAVSQLIFHCSRCSSHGVHPPSMNVVAAHADSLLVEMLYEKGKYDEYGIDYFVYNAGAGAGAAAADPPRPPSLSLLPTYWVPLSEAEKSFFPRRQGPNAHRLRGGSTGLLLRRGDDDEELVVAELLTKGNRRRDTLEDAELVVLHSGEWSATRITPIIHEDRKAGEELSYWETDMAVPVGDRRLCWVDLYRGVILCDVFDETPRRLRYVSLPVEAPAGEFDDEYDRHGDNPRHCLITTRTLYAIDGGATLKFVDIFPRCCCGRRGATQCDHSSGAFVITTWTMRMGDDDDMTWTMDAMIDATELWSLDAYAGLPHINPQLPIVSIQDPNLIYLIVPGERKRGKYHVGETIWKITMDMKSKALVSVWRDDDRSRWLLPYGCTYIPVKIPNHCVTYISCSSVTTKLSAIIDKLPITTEISSNLSQSLPLESSPKNLQVSRMASPEEILVALEEIPGLACDDLLKAYSILCRDNGRLFRSLLGLPMSLRKKWLLIEIKAYRDCPVCSASTTDHLQHD